MARHWNRGALWSCSEGSFCLTVQKVTPLCPGQPQPHPKAKRRKMVLMIDCHGFNQRSSHVHSAPNFRDRALAHDKEDDNGHRHGRSEKCPQQKQVRNHGNWSGCMLFFPGNSSFSCFWTGLYAAALPINGPRFKSLLGQETAGYLGRQDVQGGPCEYVGTGGGGGSYAGVCMAQAFYRCSAHDPLNPTQHLLTAFWSPLHPDCRQPSTTQFSIALITLSSTTPSTLSRPLQPATACYTPP